MFIDRCFARSSNVGQIAGGAILIVFLFPVAGWGQAERTGQSARPYLGVAITPAENGVAVREVTPDSPAAKAGLKSGDQIRKVDDADVKDPDNFLQTVASKKPGDKLSLHVTRDGQEQTITVTLGERPATPRTPPGGPPPQLWGPESGQRPAFLGVQTQPLTPDVSKRLDITTKGVLVTEVLPKSPAANAGLKTDDVITAIDNNPIEDPGQLREAVQRVGPGKDAAIQVTRGKENLNLTVKLGEAPTGGFPMPGSDRFPSMDFGSLMDAGRKIQQLERRIDELEKRIKELEKK
jgi:serine protease Do